MCVSVVADRISNKEFGATLKCTDNTRQFVYMEYDSRIRDFILTPVLRQCGARKCGSSSNMSGTFNSEGIICGCSHNSS